MQRKTDAKKNSKKNLKKNPKKHSRRESNLDELLKDAAKFTDGVEKEIIAPAAVAKPPHKKVATKAKVTTTKRPPMLAPPAFHYQPSVSNISTHAAILSGLNQSTTSPALNELADAALEHAQQDTQMPELISPMLNHSESSIFDEDGLIAFCGDYSTEAFFENTIKPAATRRPTDLHKAVYHENAELLQQLLAAHQIPVDALDQSDLTALTLAIYTGNRMLVKLLLDAGANKDFGREVGMDSPFTRTYNLMFAAKERKDTVAFEKYSEVLEEFQKHNVSLLPKF